MLKSLLKFCIENALHALLKHGQSISAMQALKEYVRFCTPAYFKDLCIWDLVLPPDFTSFLRQSKRNASLYDVVILSLSDMHIRMLTAPQRCRDFQLRVNSDSLSVPDNNVALHDIASAQLFPKDGYSASLTK